MAESDPRAPPPAAPSPLPSAASEQAFRSGLRALLAGDVLIAAGALDGACAAPSTIQQDACYWSAVA